MPSWVDEREWLSAVVAHAPIIAFVLDKDGCLERAEGRGLALLPGPATSLVGKSIFDLCRETPWIVDSVRRALVGEPVEVTGEYKGRWIEVHYVPLSAPAGQTRPIAGLATDVTDKVRAKDLVNELDAIVWRASATTLHVSYVSDQAERLLGYPLDAWQREPSFFIDHVEPTEQRTMLAACVAVGADGKPRRTLHRFRLADGSMRWFGTSIRTSQKAEVPAREITGMMVDLTERMRVLRSLERHDSRIRLIAEQLPAVIFTLDRDLKFTTGLGAGLKKLGLGPEMLVGLSVFEYLHTDDPNHPIVSRYRLAISEGKSFTFPADWGGMTYQCYTEPLRDEDDNIIGALTIALDKTAEKEAERERDELFQREKEARAKAEEAARRAEEALGLRDEFLSIASHELRTPITGLLLTLQILRGRVARDGSRAGQLVSICEQQGRRLATLVDGLLSATELGSARPSEELEAFDLTESVLAIVDSLAGEAKAAGCVVSVQGSHTPGRWVRSTIDQVITSLLMNAFKFGAGKPVDIEVAPSAEGARLVVQDHGIGIPAHRLQAIFGKYERAVSPMKYGGMGLGLYIARNLVEAIGGSITVTSEENRGARFVVELPSGHLHPV